jgi:hypothetical protein
MNADKTDETEYRKIGEAADCAARFDSVGRPD